MGKIKFIDLFAGIGGFHQAMHYVGAECVFASEWNKYARQSYEANYKSIAPRVFADNNRLFNEDIHDAKPKEIPNFDVCCAGLRQRLKQDILPVYYSWKTCEV